MTVPTPHRVVIALMLGIVGGQFAWFMASHVDVPRDLVQFWYAARVLIHGGDPYAAIGPGRALNYPFPLVYPLQTTIAILPFAGLPFAWACGLFFGLASFAFAWALMEHGYWPLVAFLSICFWHAAGAVQWSPLLAASLVITPLAILLVAKPTVGLAYFVARPSWYAVGGAVALTIAAFALDPQWFPQWREAVHRALAQASGFPYHAPLLMPGGVLVLAACTRWRRGEARLLVALACIPHTTLPYELLPLFLIPRGWRQCVALAGLSNLMWWLTPRSPEFYATVLAYTRAAVPCMYLPCTLMLLRRPNEGALPAWLETRLAMFPAWFRGRAPVSV